MGLFSNMMDKIFNRDSAGKKIGAPASSPPKAEPPEVKPVDLNADTVPLTMEGAAGAAEAAQPAPAPEPMEIVDVEANLNALEKAHAEDLDWKRSIVDLCKLLDIDSSYGARKEMALELGYTQEKIDADGSAEMNMWLHKEVMRRIAENGGQLPADLLD